jgi:hypothetical protein
VQQREVQELPFVRELVWGQVEPHVAQAKRSWRMRAALGSQPLTGSGQEANQGVVISAQRRVKVRELERPHALVGVEGTM